MAQESEQQNSSSTKSKSASKKIVTGVSTPPRGFRTASLIVSSLLLIALVGAIALAIMDNPQGSISQTAAVATDTAEPTSTLASPTDTPPAKAANIVETPTAEAPAETARATEPAPTQMSVSRQLGEQRVVESAGFAFQPPLGYSLEFTDDSVTLTGNARGDAPDAVMLLRADTSGALIAADADLDSAFSSIVKFISVARKVQAGEPEDVLIDGVPGRAIDLVDPEGDAGNAGRIAVTRPDANRLFLMVGFAPGPEWREDVRADFDAVLSSVEFFPPSVTPAAIAQATQPSIAVDIATPPSEETAAPTETPEATATPTPPPTLTPTPTPVSPFGPRSEWRIVSNGNFVNRIAAMSDTVWAATDGGVAAWNIDTGGHVKFTTLDGLAVNRTVDAENCPLPGFGMVFATDHGLQVFDTRSGSWKTLNSANSPMSFDDIAALYCNPNDEYLIAAYARHGLDIYEVASGEWNHIDENDGLEYGIIRDITVTDNGAIWIASQIGLTRYSDGESTLFNTDNSPMTSNAVTAIASNGGDAVWLATAGDLYRTDGEDWQSFSSATVTDSEFPNGSITGLAVAEDNTVWVGSDQTQICHFDPEAGSCVEFFSNEEGMAIARLTSLSLDQAGDVYYTTAGAGLSKYDGERWSVLFVDDEAVTGNRINDLASIEDGTVWVATDSGVSQISLADGVAVRFFTAANSSLLSQEVRAVAPVAENSAWFGTAAGANFYRDPRWNSYTEADGLAGSEVQAITIDSQNRVWIGSDAGLSIWTGRAFFNLTSDNGLPSDNISSLLSAGDLVWIGTDDGLLRYQDNQLQVFNTDNIDLPSNVITALALDADGSLLIGTAQGLVRFRDNRMIAVPDIPAAPVKSIATEENDTVWVAANEDELYYFDGAAWILVPDLALLPSPAISSLYVDENGDLWIGSSQGGLAIVTP